MAQKCNCIKTFEEKLRDRLRKETPDVDTWLDPGSFDHVTLILSKTPYTSLTMPFSARYIKRKKNGEPEKRETTIKTSLAPSFCPMCGIRIRDEENTTSLFDDEGLKEAEPLS